MCVYASSFVVVDAYFRTQDGVRTLKKAPFVKKMQKLGLCSNLSVTIPLFLSLDVGMHLAHLFHQARVPHNLDFTRFSTRVLA